MLVLCCAVSAGVHAALAPQHFEERAAAGLGFAASAVALVALAVALAHRPVPRVVDGAIAVLAGLIGAYVAAVTTGVPGLVPEAEPIVAVALVTKAVEATGLVAAIALTRAPARAARPLAISVVALVAMVSVFAIAATAAGRHTHAPDDRHEHSHASN